MIPALWLPRGWASLALVALSCPAFAQAPMGLEAATLLDASGVPGDAFGVSVALSGTRAIVGASGVDFAPGSNQGSASILERQDDGSWLAVAELVPNDPWPQSQFGIRVDLDGDQAIVGSLGLGAAYVFRRQTNATWLQTAKLVPSAPGGNLGVSVALRGNLAVLGTVAADPGGVENAGNAYVFERQVHGNWIEVAKLTASDPAAGGFFGSSLALDGDRLVVGALGVKVGFENAAGALYLFERQGDGSWLEQAKLTASDPADSDRLGQNVALSGDGIVAGVPEKWFPGAPGRGAAYVFERQGDGTWIEAVRLTDVDGGIADHFGSSVALEGSRVVVGAENDNNLITPFTSTRGSVIQFERHGDGSWAQVAKMFAQDSGYTAGQSVALSGDRVLSGHPGPGGGSPGNGSARVFRLCDGCVAGYGTGTPGCNGPQSMSLSLAPELGMSGVELTCDRAPSSIVGFGAIATAQDLAGTSLPGLGVVLHLDVSASSFLLQLPLTSDPFGQAASPPFTIPDSIALAGVTLYAQSLWPWSTCFLPPLQLSSSNGLAITLLAP